MPRRPRIEYPGAVYHVYDRGDRKEPIFLGRDDRKLFLATLQEGCLRSECSVHAMVLMPNHYHLELETPHANLVEFMHWLQGTYTQRFNRRHDLVGHVYQGRYKARPIDPSSPTYFLRVSDYIHFNPVRAGLVNPIQEPLRSFPWSSFRYFVGSQRHLDRWLKRDRLFAALGVSDNEKGRREYEHYMNERAIDLCRGLVANPSRNEEERRLEDCIGGEAFAKWIEKHQGVAGDEVSQHNGTDDPGGSLEVPMDPETLLAQVVSRLGVELQGMRSLAPSHPLKQAVAGWLRVERKLPGTWIAARLAMGHPSNVSRASGVYRADRDERVRAFKAKLP